MAGGFELAKFFIKPVFDGKGVFAGIKKFDKQLKGLNKPIKQLNSSFNGLFKLAGIAGFAKMAFDAQKLGREIGLISDKTGIAASKLAKMQSAFSATGGDAKSLNSVIQNITSGLARLSMGDAEMASKLSAMGINAWEGGKVKTSDVVLGDIAEWTKGQLEAGRSMLEVSQFLQDNFGIQQDLANQLALGREGFQQYQQAMAEKVGSLEDNEIDNLKSLNVALSRLKETVIVLADKIIAGLGPAIEFFVDLFQIAPRNLQEVFDYLIQSFSDIVGNGDEVCQLFEFLKGVLTAFSLVLKGVVDVLKGFFQAVKMIGEVLELTENKNYNPKRRPLYRLNKLPIEKREELIKENPDFGVMICRCEKVSLGEIKDAIHRSCGARTIKGVKKRVRPGFGKCQGGFCEVLVGKILASELGVEVNKINYANQGSYILLNKTKEEC